MNMRRFFCILSCFLFLIITCFVITTAKSPERYFENNLFEYGSSYTLTEGNATITSSNSNIARVSGNTVNIVGTGSFILTFKAKDVSKEMKCFAWNVCLKVGKCDTYVDSGLADNLEPLYGRTYLAVTKSGKSLKVNDYLCATGSYKGDLKGKYILNASDTADAKNFIFYFTKSGITYDGNLRSLGIQTDETGTKTENENKGRKLITIKYRVYKKGEIGEAIDWVKDETVSIVEETIIRRNKNGIIVQNGYDYKGVSIDGGKISSNKVIEAKVDLSNSSVTFWYVEREKTPDKQANIDLSQLQGTNITVSQYGDFGMYYDYNFDNIDLSQLKSLTKLHVGVIVSNFAKYIVKTQQSEWIYSFGMNHHYGEGKDGYGGCYYVENTYLYKKSSGWAYGTSIVKSGPYKKFSNMYSTDCGGFCSVMYHWALGIGKDNSFTGFGDYTYKVGYHVPKYLNASTADAYLFPGDIVHVTNHYYMYVGHGMLAEMQVQGILYESINKYSGREVLDVRRITQDGLDQINAHLDKVRLQFLFSDSLNATGLILN